MPVKPKPAVFITSDSEEFATEKEAKAHEELLEAATDFSRARSRLSKATANKLKTADGCLFKLDSWNDYFYVVKWGNFGPCLRKLSFGYSTHIVLGCHDNSEVRLILDGDKSAQQFAISNLYASEVKAKMALADAIREHIAVKQKELEGLEE